MATEQSGQPTLRRATIEVTYDPHGRRAPWSDIDWAYHLRMGDVDAESVLVVSDRALQPFEVVPDVAPAIDDATDEEAEAAAAAHREENWND